MDSFNSRTSGGELLNVKYDPKSKIQTATVFLPEDKKENLLKTVDKYLNQSTRKGEPASKYFINRIDSFYKSSFFDFWVGNPDFIPNKEVRSWVELWFSIEENIDDYQIEHIKPILLVNDIQFDDNVLFFPERSIISVKVNLEELEELINSFPFIAEIRKSEELNSYWLDSGWKESEEWVKDLIERVSFNTDTNNYITVIDSGVNNGNPLISPVLSDNDKLTCNINWGVNDIGARGHGTKMSGVAVYGDLKMLLESLEDKEINHRLESVKIIPPNGWKDDSRLPFYTDFAIKTAIINNPSFKRIFCFAISSQVDFDFGKPSAWSAIIDRNVFGEDNEDKKVFLISAGNVQKEYEYKDYPESNLNSQIFNPAQSWNAITVGAYTQKILPNLDMLAQVNELSPFSRTSSAWEPSWPIKPDVVFEGGNLIIRKNGDIDGDEDLELLTTSPQVTSFNEFSTINATSAATALASNFMAELRNVYNEAWEETLRGLMIHSASWTDEMKSQLNYDSSQKSKILMLRTYGYGVPDLIKAKESKTNFLTFISEEEIQPYFKDLDGSIKTKDVHFYQFPWPKETLQSMAEAEVKIKITLSYFIEPNPGEKGYSTKYSYQSAALKFSLMPANDDPDNFMLSINNMPRNKIKEALGIDKNKGLPDGYFSKKTNIPWDLGKNNVFKGSVHSNSCTLTAADASNCEYVAVCPQASGWWKNLKKMNRFNEKMRYSLIVSLEVPENSEDIYTEIVNRVQVENLIKV
ncbi:S8 family peptidase [Polaribacter sp. L3A8]|uniref:S8 family peptidase n=1 Tax=Polaribacter sp. L3A8 TaxID=2686361 RepID=UPI00131DA6B3|nr:S8 family peptidase [Polaribacter sp. L3A8]